MDVESDHEHPALLQLARDIPARIGGGVRRARVRGLRHAETHRALRRGAPGAPDVYSRVLTQDFVFEFASGDSTAVSWKAIPWGRDDEILSALHLFEDGTASEPPATSIDLQETQAVADDPDPLPGHGSKWHRMLTLQTLLRVNIPGGTWEVRGPAYLFIVRGDSADIPVDLLVQGMKRDSTQWWIEHWVDGTLSSATAARVRRSPGPAQTMPRRAFTWGDLKALYR